MRVEGLTDKRREAIAEACKRHAITLCYLFGSRATGFADAASDWDLGVVFDRARVASVDTDLWLDVVPDFEAVFAPERVDLVFLQQAAPALRSEAIQGSLVFAETDLDRADFEERVMRIWMDLRPFIEAQERDLAEVLLREHRARQ